MWSKLPYRGQMDVMAFIQMAPETDHPGCFLGRNTSTDSRLNQIE